MYKLNYVLVILLMTTMTVACQAPEKTSDQSEATQTEQEDNGIISFGEAFEAVDVVAFNELSGKVNEQDSIQLTVRGTVNEVCQSKGCWMTIQGGEHEGMMVRFKDYGFFMPKDIAGREVIMKGQAFYQTTSVDELRHYAEDAGKSKEEIEAITEPKHEMGFLAEGVILVNE